LGVETGKGEAWQFQLLLCILFVKVGFRAFWGCFGWKALPSGWFIPSEDATRWNSLVSLEMQFLFFDGSQGKTRKRPILLFLEYSSALHSSPQILPEKEQLMNSKEFSRKSETPVK